MTFGPDPVETLAMFRDLLAGPFASDVSEPRRVGLGRRFSASAVALLVATASWFLPGLASAQRSAEHTSTKRAPKVAASSPRDHAEVTFTGYHSLPGGRGVVFVELSEPVPVEVSRTGQVIQYKLVGATVPLRNNRNPLLLRDFRSSALSAVLVTDKPASRRHAAKSSPPPSVRLVVTLRDNVAPSYRMVSRGKGAALEVELPAPK